MQSTKIVFMFVKRPELIRIHNIRTVIVIPYIIFTDLNSESSQTCCTVNPVFGKRNRYQIKN